MMNATQITPTQLHLLKLFSFDKSESRALEIKDVLMRYFQSRLDAEADRLWDEGVLKNLYDYTWVMEVMNQTKNMPKFDTPASFITYMEDLGIKRLPSEDTIIKKKNKFIGIFPDWKFTDCDTTEATRRINVGKRFLSLFRKS